MIEPSRKAIFEQLLYGGDRVYLLVHSGVEGVCVPDGYAHDDHVLLELGYHMPVPMEDLHIEEDQLSVVLTFSRTPHKCIIPWTAVRIIRGWNFQGSWGVHPVHPPKDLPSKSSKPKLRAVK